MLGAGQKLKRARTALKLTYREVEEASQKIAERHGNDEFAIALSRLSDIENKGMVPTIFRIYSLCIIYRLDIHEVLAWYGVDCSEMAAEAVSIPLKQTHLIGISPGPNGHLLAPLAVDPILDGEQTVFLSGLIQRWGRLPMALLKGFDVRNRRYGLIGQDDRTMYPILPPGSLVVIDDSRRKIAHQGWNTEFERPIYFFELRDGYACGWCDLAGDRLIVQPHPASGCRPAVYTHPTEIEVIGQVTGVAMCLISSHMRSARNGANPALSPDLLQKAAVPLP
jgi:transcriptional regulator with XRE-family HTH domain